MAQEDLVPLKEANTANYWQALQLVDCNQCDLRGVLVHLSRTAPVRIQKKMLATWWVDLPCQVGITRWGVGHNWRCSWQHQRHP